MQMDKINRKLDEIFATSEAERLVAQFASDGGIDCKWASDHVDAIVDRADCAAILSDLYEITNQRESRYAQSADQLCAMIQDEIERRHNDAVRENGGEFCDEPDYSRD